MADKQVLKEFYAKGYGKTDALEIPINKKDGLKDKVAVLIDDGIASGGSAEACCKLLEQLNVSVKLVLAMIKHQYAQTNASLFTPFRKVKTLFDFENLPVEKAQPVACAAEGQKLPENKTSTLCH
jgi:adenine/guanine phosphoribosyltransferase-like PRPP-binding protein